MSCGTGTFSRSSRSTGRFCFYRSGLIVTFLNVDHPANDVPDQGSDEHVVELHIAVAENVPARQTWDLDGIIKFCCRLICIWSISDASQ